ncbi:hypothetical protein E2C01_057795 [Portunus trituberculatus]|uniref:Uncharacterized protein n=1 Tax=Portunus trituberculatus TaxID=210409 RepID=A0A5B7H0Z0_PORTR|nr:hypothetical protein [Portunus trituberculatus]
MNAKVRCERKVIQSLREKGVEGRREWYRFLRGEGMPDSENVESLRVNGALVTDKEDMRRVIKEFWEEIGGVDEVFGVREGCVTLERKDADEMNERISREEKCVRRQKNGKAAGPDERPYEMYRNGGEVRHNGFNEMPVSPATRPSVRSQLPHRKQRRSSSAVYFGYRHSPRSLAW